MTRPPPEGRTGRGRRAGRRPGKPDTREQILAAARAAFAELGYDRTSIRRIATDAGVDPALVHHYFATKERLFTAVVEFPVNPAEIVDGVLSGNPDGIGERLIGTFITIWDSPAGAGGIALFRSAVNHAWVARLLREFITVTIFSRIAEIHQMSTEEGRLRGSLVASQLTGLIAARYILEIEPLASLPREQVVAAIAPTIQRYISGALA